MSLFFTNEGYYPNIIVYLNVIHCPKDIHVPQWIRLAPIQMTYLLIKQGLKVMSGFVTLPESIPVSNLCTCLSLSLDDFPVGNLEDWFVYRTWMTSRDPISMETSMGIYFAGNHHELPRLYNEDPAQDNADQRQWQAIFSSIIKQIAINACACDRVTSLLGRTHFLRMKFRNSCRESSIEVIHWAISCTK